MCEKPPLLEVEVIRDTFVSGVGAVEILGPNARITLYVNQAAIGGGEPDRVVVDKIVVALDAIPIGIGVVLHATWHLISHWWVNDTSEARHTKHH
jgi:hypothetical protein